MNLLTYIQNLTVRGIHAFSGKFFHRQPAFPLADRLLADLLRLAEIPSPSPQEGERAAFVLERLRLLGTAPWVDEDGNVYVRLHSAASAEAAPLLLFADLGSRRWHPLESLSRLDAFQARGAGLADVLGVAALLYAAEAVSQGRLKSGRDILLLFAARSFEDPESRVFALITENRFNHPFAAVGFRGFTLGSMITHARGIYRMALSLETLRNEKESEEEEAPKKKESGPENPNLVVDTLIAAAARLSASWASNEKIRLYIRSIKALSGYGRTPSEGVLEFELESGPPPERSAPQKEPESVPVPAGTLLEEAMAGAKAVAGAAIEHPELKGAVTITAFVPAGDPGLTAGLSRLIGNIMRDLRIKVREEDGSDPSAFLSNRGIPAVSLGIARGWEGLSMDTVEIASIEKGRQLIDKVIEVLTSGVEFAEMPDKEQR
ncbi:MAG: hypothetical protein LBO80_09435 [Treponema sp.]|nr:hypothetical protein [Treponema sp.]